MARSVPADSPAPVCRLSAVPDGSSRGFETILAGERVPAFLVRRGERVYGYRNRCPHRGSPLDWQPHDFLERDGSLIVCASHGARFRIEDGLCIAGPCAGDALTRLPLAVRDGEVVVEAS